MNERRAMGCTGERSTAAGGLLRRSVAFSTALTLPADLALRSTWLARPTMLKRWRTRRLTGTATPGFCPPALPPTNDAGTSRPPGSQMPPKSAC